MKLRNPLYSLLCLLLALALPGVATAVDGPDFVTLAKNLKPAVVNINTSKTVQPRRPMLPGPRSPQDQLFEDFFDRFFGGQPVPPRKERSLGSGFIISKDGYILSNNHVVEGADEVNIKLADGRSFKATVKGLDPKLDIALLKIDTDEELPVARIGDSEGLKVGEWVMAIGNPFGLEQTVTVGIVSAKGRVIGAGPYDNFIQTDASINPGNSGGPLFNIKGEVVGINTAIVAGGQGIGFALPINAASAIVPQLKETGHVTRGWLGVSIQQVNEELAASFGLDKARGALVAEVVKDSPAEKAGFKRGDIILGFDGKPIEEMSDLPRLVAATAVGKSVKLEVWREGKTRELSVKIGKLDEDEAAAAAAPEGAGVLGLSVTDLTPEIARSQGLEGTRGALVTAVDPQGPAAESNLRPGDVVLEVNGSEVKDAAAFRSAVGKPEAGKVLRLLVQRGQNLFYTTLKVK
ncbi:peptidase [Desulfuromonas versatilis]|uniref:Probable periplasmic serine endoprotease DegP-like n=1 Tax=Desulfuromonas versatilis TaxID=2802975 RepID=A0ABM8HSS6_9BACT|nr:DegQ family serine endoprotease [Desulfuromonas versatilis]BCR03517.1 peptidase [Desulfuromonas versatilis]